MKSRRISSHKLLKKLRLKTLSLTSDRNMVIELNTTANDKSNKEVRKHYLKEI